MGERVQGLLATEACLAAARILGGDPGGDAVPDAEAADLLAALDYDDCSEASELDNRRALLRLAGRMRRLFRIPPPDAPNLVFLGAEADGRLAWPAGGPDDPVSLSGAGMSLAEAFERCIGEAAEYLSRIETDADIVDRGRPSEVAHGLGRDTLSDLLAMLARSDGAADPELDWVAGRSLCGSMPVRLPADLCLRPLDAGRQCAPLIGTGTGCAAGPTVDAAALAAVLEVIERDAAALWWRGGRPPRPITLETCGSVGAGALLLRLRGETATRHSRLLDITTDLGVPCVASVSLARDGKGFACGLAAGLTIGAAIRSAIVEMCQMELSHRVIALKRRQRGDAALNAQDLTHLERGRTIDADSPLIQPKGYPNEFPVESNMPAQLELSFKHIVRRIEEIGAKIFMVDLTRDRFAIPVMKVIATGLQPYPAEFETERLKKSIEQHSGESRTGHSVPLL